MISALSGERGVILQLNGRGAVESPYASQRRSALCDITSIHLFIIEYIRLYGISIPVRVRGEVKCPKEVHSVDVLNEICEEGTIMAVVRQRTVEFCAT
jgi:hypothetical protein